MSDVMRQLTIPQIAESLIGSVEFSGDHGIDMQRVGNIEEGGELGLAMVQALMRLTRLRHNHQDSAKQMATKAQFYIDEIKEWL